MPQRARQEPVPSHCNTETQSKQADEAKEEQGGKNSGETDADTRGPAHVWHTACND